MPTQRRRPSRRLLLTAILAVLVLAAAAVALFTGGTTGRRAATGPPSYLLSSGEQPGYTVTSTPSAVKLEQPGFRIGVQETLGAPNGRAGFTLFTEFATAAQARASAARYLRVAKSGVGKLTLRTFTVPGVRGSQGFTGQGAVEGVADAYWTVGRCMLGSGLFLPNAPGKSVAALAAPVIAGIESQSSRIDDRCP
jgi:hypothetical protein